MSFGAVAGAVIGGGLSYAASREQSKPRTSTSAPWRPQQQHLVDAWQGANQYWRDSIAQGPYAGDRVANWTTGQNTGYQNTMADAGTQRGYGNTLVANGMQTAGNIGQAGRNANSVFGRTMQDQTGNIINNAGRFADNPYMNSMIDAASSDVMRNMKEKGMTQLDLGATAAGNMNSSRTGISEGIMKRGAAEEIAQISATLRGNAYQNGLGMAQDQVNSDFRNQLAANQQVLGTGQAGTETMQAGVNMRNEANTNQFNMGSQWQAQNQREIDGARERYEDFRQNGLNQTDRYMGIIQGNYGGTQTQSGPTNYVNSIMGGMIGGAGIGSQIARGMGGTYSGPSYASMGYNGQSYGAYMNPFGGYGG